MPLSPEIGIIKIVRVPQRFKGETSAIAWNVSDRLVIGPEGLNSGCHTLGEERVSLIDECITKHLSSAGTGAGVVGRTVTGRWI
ncbi:MAG: hypothetical protein Q9202_003360 [Teloschistes flavicans]